MSKDHNTIIVSTNDLIDARGMHNQELQVDVLGENINLFITQIGAILDKTPDHIEKFRLTQIAVTAEISAKGSLILLGTGVETEGKGGLSFVFTRT